MLLRLYSKERERKEKKEEEKKKRNKINEKGEARERFK